MRFLNLDVDELYLMATSELLGCLTMVLGTKCDSGEPNTVLLDGDDGWNVVEDSVLSESNFILSIKDDYPVIRHCRYTVSDSTKLVLLKTYLGFRGSYSSHTTDDITLPLFDVIQPQIIAKGYYDDPLEGRVVVSLVSLTDCIEKLIGA